MSSDGAIFDFQPMPTDALDGEIWIQCHLRLTLQFQARQGISLHLADPSRRCLRIGLGEILDHRSGRAVYDAMMKLTLEEDLQSDFLEQMRDLDHLDPGHAGRLAFNIVMDKRWETIERSALEYYEAETAINGEFSAA